MDKSPDMLKIEKKLGGCHMIDRGGKNEDRLYLHDRNFFRGKEPVVVKKTDMPNIEAIIHRHKARYYMPAFFCRYQSNVLDFPCGSGYGIEILGKGTNYEGFDNDEITMEYARKTYCNSIKTFRTMDLTAPRIEKGKYDVIACIEGIEHIEGEYQGPLVKAFYDGLKPGGRLIVTCPKAPEASGPSKTNKYHLYELTTDDFKKLIKTCFVLSTFITTRDILHNGEEAICMTAICEKEGVQ